jgi:hypothetical protein
MGDCKFAASGSPSVTACSVIPEGLNLQCAMRAMFVVIDLPVSPRGSTPRPQGRHNLLFRIFTCLRGLPLLSGGRQRSRLFQFSLLYSGEKVNACSCLTASFAIDRKPFPWMCDSTYYQSALGSVMGMLRKVPDDFMFNVKGHRDLTHSWGLGQRTRSRNFFRGSSPFERSTNWDNRVVTRPDAVHRGISSLTMAHRAHYGGIAGHMGGMDLPNVKPLPTSLVDATAPVTMYAFMGALPRNGWAGDAERTL